MGACVCCAYLSVHVEEAGAEQGVRGHLVDEHLLQLLHLPTPHAHHTRTFRQSLHPYASLNRAVGDCSHSGGKPTHLSAELGRLAPCVDLGLPLLLGELVPPPGRHKVQHARRLVLVPVVDQQRERGQGHGVLLLLEVQVAREQRLVLQLQVHEVLEHGVLGRGRAVGQEQLALEHELEVAPLPHLLHQHAAHEVLQLQIDRENQHPPSLFSRSSFMGITYCNGIV